MVTRCLAVAAAVCGVHAVLVASCGPMGDADPPAGTGGAAVSDAAGGPGEAASDITLTQIDVG